MGVASGRRLGDAGASEDSFLGWARGLKAE